LGRIPGDLTCMLANASLSIPLPNKGTFIEIGGLVNSRFLGGTGLPLQYLLHCSQSTLHLSRLSTQVCKQLKFLAASSLTFHSYPLVSWPPNKGWFSCDTTIWVPHPNEVKSGDNHGQLLE
jgi:hypothetical protein